MMEKQSAKKLLVIVAVFYVATAVLAVCILNLSGSIFAGRGDMDMLGYLKNMRGGEDKLVTDEAESEEGSGKVEGLEALGSDEEPAVSEDAVYEEVATEPATEEASEETEVADRAGRGDVGEATKTTRTPKTPRTEPLECDQEFSDGPESHQGEGASKYPCVPESRSWPSLFTSRPILAHPKASPKLKTALVYPSISSVYLLKNETL